MAIPIHTTFPYPMLRYPRSDPRDDDRPNPYLRFFDENPNLERVFRLKFRIRPTSSSDVSAVLFLMLSGI